MNRAALAAFAFHAPGLWVLSGLRLPAGWVVANIVALALTVVAVVFAALRDGLGWVPVAVWATGHFAWSVCLVAAVRRGIATRRAPEPDAPVI